MVFSELAEQLIEAELGLRCSLCKGEDHLVAELVEGFLVEHASNEYGDKDDDE